MPEFEDIAAVRHGDGDADSRRAVVEHLRIGRLDVAPLDLCDIAETKDAPVRGDGQRADILDVFKDARGAQIHIVRLRLDAPRRHHRILSRQSVRDDLRADAELREAVERDLDVDALALDADEDDLLHARHGEDAAAGVLRHGAQLLIGVVCARDGVDRAVHVVESVVVVGTEHAVRQIPFDIFAEVMHVAPRRANLRLVHLGTQLQIDDGLPGARLALDLLHPRDVLEPALELVRDLLLHLLCRCARPCGGDDHLADGERGILHAPE